MLISEEQIQRLAEAEIEKSRLSKEINEVEKPVRSDREKMEVRIRHVAKEYCKIWRHTLYNDRDCPMIIDLDFSKREWDASGFSSCDLFSMPFSMLTSDDWIEEEKKLSEKHYKRLDEKKKKLKEKREKMKQVEAELAKVKKELKKKYGVTSG